MSEPNTSFEGAMSMLRRAANVEHLSPLLIRSLQHIVTQTMRQEPFHIKYTDHAGLTTFVIEDSQKQRLLTTPYHYARRADAEKAAWGVRLRLLYNHRRTFG